MRRAAALTILTAAQWLGAAAAQESDPVNPFGPQATELADARPGRLELSDGTVLQGQVFLTRDARLRIYDGRLKRFREVPLAAVKSIEARIQREWLERQWRFQENANDVKVYTGRSYPARTYVYTITLSDGREITGPLSALVYVQVNGEPQPRKYVLHKRHKGAIDMDLSALVYVRRIELTDELPPGASGHAASPESDEPPGRTAAGVEPR